MKLLVANWKMAPDTQSQAIALAKATAQIAKKFKKNISVIACVPFVHTAPVRKVAKTLTLGAQAVAASTEVAQTGLVSATMLKSAGVSYCIVGHSESRTRGETHEIVKGQIDCLLEKKLIPIICVGEKTRDAQGWYLSTIKEQFESALQGVPKAALKRIIVAYEPVWAIGKDAVRQASPQECQEMVIFIRKIITDLYDEKTAAAVPILYGGSVTEENAGAFVQDGGAKGLLVGRVSLDPKRFAKIAESMHI